MNIVYIIFTAVLVVSVIIGTYIHASGFKYATEGSASLLLGTAITGLISVCYYLDTGSALTPASLRLPDAVFFQVLLPPIIFYAGFSVKKRMFFRNFATIFTFGFFGTLTSAAAISTAAAVVLDRMGIAPGAVFQSALALGAICACSDTVAILQIMDPKAYPVLHSLVFGEGIVNDAVGIVLLSSVHNLAAHHTSLTLAVVLELLLSFVSLFVSSLLLGVSVGLGSALMVRRIFAKHHDCDREVLLLALLGYLSYLLADAFELSAILSVFFCGVTMSHYTWHSLSPAAQALALHTFRLTSGLMEMILYAYSGINIWTSALWQAGDSRQHITQALSLAGTLLLATVVARVAFTYPAAAAASWIMTHPHKQQQQLQESQEQLLPAPDRQQQCRRISMLDATVLMWGGLCRGALTLALAYHHFSIPTPANQVMAVAVVLVVLVSSVVLGTVTGPLMQIIMTKHKQQQREAWQQHKQQQHLAEPLLLDIQQQQGDGVLITPGGTVQVPVLHSGVWHGSSSAQRSPFARGRSSSSSNGLGVAAEISRETVQRQVGADQSGATDDAGIACELLTNGARDGLGASGVTGTAELSVTQQITAAAAAAAGSASSLQDSSAAAGATDAVMVSAGRQAKRSATAPGPAAAAQGLESSSTLWRNHPSRRSLPSLDELTEYTRQQELDKLRDLATAAAAASARTQDQQQQQQQQGLTSLSRISESVISQQLQRLQRGSYGSISGVAAADLPVARSPSEVQVALLGTYLALSRSGCSAGEGRGSVHGQQWLQGQQWLEGQQWLQPQQPQHGVVGAVQQEPVVEDQPVADWAAQQQQQQQMNPDWYIQQQLQLLQQIAQLQHEHLRLRQQQQTQSARDSAVSAAAQRSSGWHDLHGVWRRFDKRYLQPVFGGREVARLTSTPSDFEHFV